MMVQCHQLRWAEHLLAFCCCGFLGLLQLCAVDFALLYQPLEAMAASNDYFTYVIKVRGSAV
jgi:hypothetical protein